MFDDRDNRGNARRYELHERGHISGERKTIYYVGLGLTILGFILFFSIFISVATGFGGMMSGPGPGGFMPDAGFSLFGSFFLRAILGMGLMIVGSILMRVGSRGLAGSGVMLDPDQARRDLEPWSRMAGGMAHDALDEADIHLGGPDQDGEELPFDEKLRRLERLHAEGLLTEAEYQRKRAEILSEKW